MLSSNNNQTNENNENNNIFSSFQLTEDENFFLNNINFAFNENDNFFNEDPAFYMNILKNERNNISDNSISDTDKSVDRQNLDTSSHTSKGKTIQNPFSNTYNSSQASNIEATSLLNKKKGRPISDTHAILTIDNKLVQPNDEDYMKERKKIQNRESQLRSRQRKKEVFLKNHEKVEELMIENERLKAENRNLVEDRSFLVEQIRFLQGLISKNMPMLKHSSEISVDKEKGKIENGKQSMSKRVFISNDNKKDKFIKAVNIGFVALLGVLCVLVNIDKYEIDDYSLLSIGNGNGYRVKSERSDYYSKDTDYIYSFAIRSMSFILFICSFIILIYSLVFKRYFVKWEKLK